MSGTLEEVSTAGNKDECLDRWGEKGITLGEGGRGEFSRKVYHQHLPVISLNLSHHLTELCHEQIALLHSWGRALPQRAAKLSLHTGYYERALSLRGGGKKTKKQNPLYLLDAAFLCALCHVSARCA